MSGLWANLPRPLFRVWRRFGYPSRPPKHPTAKPSHPPKPCKFWEQTQGLVKMLTHPTLPTDRASSVRISRPTEQSQPSQPTEPSSIRIFRSKVSRAKASPNQTPLQFPEHRESKYTKAEPRLDSRSDVSRSRQTTPTQASYAVRPTPTFALYKQKSAKLPQRFI